MNQSAIFRTRWRRLIQAVGFFYLALLGWSRLQQSVLDWDLLQELGVQPGPLYLAAGGAVWGVLGLAAAVLSFVPRRWASRLVFGAALVLTATYWADFLIFTRAAEMMVNWPFALGVTLVGLLYCAWVTQITA